MKKFLLFLALIPCFVQAQQTYFTPGIPPSSLSFTPTFRFKNGSVDSLNNIYLAIGNKWYQVYTAAQANARFTGGGGGASWGSITGTLSAQIDLNTALNGKLSKTFSSNQTITLGGDTLKFGTHGTFIADSAMAAVGNQGFASMLPASFRLGKNLTTWLSITGGSSANTITGNPITITPKVSFAVNPALGATSTVGYVPTATNTSGDWSWTAPAGGSTGINGLNGTTNIGLGGTLASGGATIITGSQNLILQDASSGTKVQYAQNGNSINMFSGDGTNAGSISLTSNGAQLQYTGYGYDSSYGSQYIKLEGSDMKVFDGIYSLGLQYYSNYTTNQRLQRLSIPSVNTVIALADSVKATMSAGGVTAVTGTTNRITSTGGATPVIDISASYVGQTSITTLGTIATGSIPYSLITGTPSLTGYVPYSGATGNVNLGTNFIAAGASLTPLVPVHAISTISTNPRGILSDQNTADAVGARITMRKSRGTPASPTVITTGDVLGSWAAAGHDGTNYIDAGKVLVTSTGTIGTGIVPSIMELQTMNAAGTLTDGIKIDQAQQLTFGGYSTTGLAHLTGGALTSSLLVNADITAGTITNASLANSSTTINGTSIALGASGTVTAAAGTLTGSTLNSSVTASSLTSFGAGIALGTPASGVMTNVTGLPLTTGVTGVLPTANGGTNLSSYTAGDLPYASATNVLSKLAIGATGNPLTVIGGVPAYSNLVLTNPASAATFTLAAGKTFTNNNTITLATATSADGNTYTLPAASQTLASLAGAETLTNKSLTSPTITTGTFSGNQAGNVNFSGNVGVIGRFTTISGFVQKAVTTAINTSATVTSAQLAGGCLSSTSAATVTMTMPTATSMASTISATQGTQFQFTVDNTAGANTVTVAVGSGMTAVSALTGGTTLTVPSGQSGTFLLIFSSATVCQISRVQ